MLLPNAEQMRRIDQCAIDRFHIPGIVLMENAGLGTVLLMERRVGPISGAFIPIFIGPGNNGGDGLVIGRHLHQRGCTPLLVYLVEPQRLKGDSGANQKIVESLDLPAIVCCSSAAVDRLRLDLQQMEAQHGPISALVDSIFGTGLDRAVEGHFSSAIALINEYGSSRNIPVIAVDTPSGLGSDDGVIFNSCVRATLTASFGYAKVGQVLPESERYTGALEIIDIGIPAEVASHINVNTATIDRSDCSYLGSLLRREPAGHKGNFGHLLIIAGSPGKTGAAILAAQGALKSGCGLISLCAPAHLNPVYETTLTEPMSLVLDSANLFSIDDLPAILSHLQGKNCLVIGPGIGLHRKTAELVIELYNTVSVPMVIDADGLTIMASRRDHLVPPPGPRILTPHPGEMARLTGRSNAAVQQDRFTALHDCYQEFRTSEAELIILLKGSGTLITDGTTTWINRSGNPGMASGGMGDVLSGLIGSLVCQGLSCCEASRFAAFVHGFSGDRLQESKGTGFTASALADDLSAALLTLTGEDR